MFMRIYLHDIDVVYVSVTCTVIVFFFLSFTYCYMCFRFNYVTGHFAHETFRLLPGQFAYKLLILLTRLTE